MKRTPAVLLALLVAFAGCAGLSGPQGPTETPDTTEPDPNATDGDVAFPPGTDERGIANATALLEAHSTALNGTARRESLTSDRGGSVAGRTEIVVATDGRRTLTRTSTDGRTTTVWETDYGTATRLAASGETTYSYAGGDAARGRFSGSVGRLTQAGVLEAYLRVGAYEYRGTERLDGRRALRYEATSVNASVLSDAAPDALDVELLVSPDGVVRRLNATSRDRVDGRNETGEVAYRVDGRGETTVSEPAWVDANVPQMTLTRGDGGRTATLRHVGGPALPAGASIVTDDPSGYATLDATLEPGESVTVAVGDDGAVLARDGAPSIDGARLDGRVRVLSAGDGATVRSALAAD